MGAGFGRIVHVMAEVLIAGGAGFIGANLARRLVAAGHSVTVLDNFWSGRRANMAGMDVRLIAGDVREPIAGRYDWVFNLACPASPPRYQRDPVFTLTTSIDGMRQVLALARRCGARVVHASTSEIYGDPLMHPQTETYWGHVNPLGPRSCYDEGKRVAETLAMEARRAWGVDVRVARIFNTYGPFMDPADGRVVSNFIMQALHGEALTLYGEGRQTRGFQFVDDLLAGFMAYVTKPRAEVDAFFAAKGMALPVLNLGNPEEITVRELADEVLRLVPSGGGIVSRPLPKDDPHRRRPDIAWARDCLGWEPRVHLREGLSRTVAYFREGPAAGHMNA